MTPVTILTGRDLDRRIAITTSIQRRADTLAATYPPEQWPDLLVESVGEIFVRLRRGHEYRPPLEQLAALALLLSEAEARETDQ